MVENLIGEGSRISTLAIVATLNEEEGVGPTLAELQHYLGNASILVVDGRSHDRTVKIAKDLGVEVIFQTHRGKGDAIAEAIKHVSENFGYSNPDLKYIIITDADFTYPAKHLLEMLDILEVNPKIGMVSGNRFNSHVDFDAMKNLFSIGNRALAFTHNLLNGVNLRDPLTGLRIVRWNILRDWVPKSTGFDIEVELNHLVERKGYNIREIDIGYRPRLGEKKLKLRHGLTILNRILLESVRA